MQVERLDGRLVPRARAPTKEEDSMAQTKRSARAEATRIADLVRRAVDDGARTAEDIHKSIADLPLDVLQRLDLFEKTAKDVKKIQDTSIGAVYDLIRKVNLEVGKLASDLLERPAKRPPRKKTAPAKPGRAAARA
jgi:hypothetical protein